MTMPQDVLDRSLTKGPPQPPPGETGGALMKGPQPPGEAGCEELANKAGLAADALTLRSLLSRCRVEAVAIDLRHRLLFNTWVRFRRRLRGRSELPMPEPVRASDGSWRLRLQSKGSRHLRFTLPAQLGERFVGFGERFNSVDQRGERLEVWTEEGAIGFGERLSPLLTRLRAAFNPFPKGPTTAYKPMPWFISSRGYGLHLVTSCPVFFDVAATSDDAVVCDIIASDVELVFYLGATPKAILQQFARATGLPRPLPAWAVGPWNDAVGGAANVERVAALLRRERIPSTAIWTEDWGGAQWSFAGNTRWSWYNINPVRRTVDRSLYPQIERQAAALHAQGFKFLSYYYPFIPADDPDFAFARSQGFLLRDEAGQPLVFKFFIDRCGQIDLTNPAAKAWYAGELRRGIELGFDGWMADFGEYTPIASTTADGQRGLQHHNAYPLLWASLNRAVWDEARPDGDFVFISRSAAVGQQAVTPVFWSGDSNTDFERWDGLPANLPGLLSAGLSGLAIWTTDVGGYMSLLTAARDPEVLARWSEFAAFLPVMRTHHGTHPRRSVQFDHTPATLRHYAHYARMHTSLYPHLQRLIDEAVATGLPVCRPLLLEFPDDAASWAVADAFLLGPDLLVAPVLERGAGGRLVYLPAGERWLNLWTGQAVAGGQTLWVAAPLGEIPLFLRDGGALILLGRYIDTLVSRASGVDASLATREDGEEHLLVLLTPGARGDIPCYGSHRLQVAQQPGGLPLAAATLATPLELQEFLPPGLGDYWRPLAGGFGQNGSLRLPWQAADCWLNVHSRVTRRWSVYGLGGEG